MTITQSQSKKKKHGERVCNMVKGNNIDTRTTLIDFVLWSFLLTLNIFRTRFDVSIVDFEHVLAC